MDDALLVYTTFPDEETALAIAEALVRDKLAACVNVIPGMKSVYAWQGAMERGDEVVGIVKTRAGLRDAVREALKARHPYATPIVLFIPIAGGDAGTLKWLMSETGGDAAPARSP
ncbi:MAG TPA: divalent-cation tolerance protein CutA [Beijerinckiaceae bacterium]|nr:divalent-cation tolerance protein CutA [Beijerinckiaceae bacterium]